MPRAKKLRVGDADLAVNSELTDGGQGFVFRLKHAILHRGMQEHRTIGNIELSREIGGYDQLITRFIWNNKRPDFATVALIAKRLRCHPGWLAFGGSYGRPGTVGDASNVVPSYHGSAAATGEAGKTGKKPGRTKKA